MLENALDKRPTALLLPNIQGIRKLCHPIAKKSNNGSILPIKGTSGIIVRLNKHHTMTEEIQKPVTLSRTLGIFEVIFLGVGALLGGGIFTLLGHVAGLSGGGLLLAIIIGAAISFFNLNSYISLATTFPGAGGGYVWVRDGLGDINGFLSGWLSWMASSVACSLYSSSFSIFAIELFFNILKIPTLNIPLTAWRIIFTIGIIIIFGIVNYRGASFFGKIGGRISIIVLTILGLYIIFGLKRIIVEPELLIKNLTPLLPFGLLGVMQAAGLFYIAFEGTEIQAQTGEEVKDPAHTLKIGLFGSWGIISILYLLISFVIISATDGGSMPSWQLLGQSGEHAILESARQILPYGYVLMVLAGILANVAALNATIYSSSRVLFAMARDKSVLHFFSRIHPKNYTPHYAIILSVLIVILVATFLPIKDIAGAADVLFILLFLQLNMSYIQLRRKRPEARWQYIVPGGMIMPICAMILYLILGISLFHVSQIAIYFTIIWFLLGLINYYSYTKTERRQDLDKEIRYGHTSRFREKTGYRIILPVSSEEYHREFSRLALAMAQSEGGEILALRIHKIPPTLPLNAAFNQEHEKRVLDEIEIEASDKKINIDTRLVAARSISDTILDTVTVEDGDLLIMGWDGYVNSKGFVFGKNVDAVLRQTKCDLAIVKICNHPLLANKILLPITFENNPNLRFTGKMASALLSQYGGQLTIVMFAPQNTRPGWEENVQAIFTERLAELKIKTSINIQTKIVYSEYKASAILKEVEEYDTLLLPAGRESLSQVIGMGTVSEHSAKLCRKNAIIARGYRGIIEPFFEYLKSRF